MMAIFGALLPRFVILAGWINDQAGWKAVFGSEIWLLGGFIFLPWTTLAWTVAYAPIQGVTGFGWFFVIFAFLVDIGTHIGSAQARRDQRSRMA